MEKAEEGGKEGREKRGWVREGKSEGAGLYPVNGTLGVFPKNPLVFII